MRALIGLDQRLGRHAVGPPCLRAIKAADCLAISPNIKRNFFDVAADLRARSGAILVGWRRERRDAPTYGDAERAAGGGSFEAAIVNPPDKRAPLDWRGDDLLIVVEAPVRVASKHHPPGASRGHLSS